MPLTLRNVFLVISLNLLGCNALQSAEPLRLLTEYNPPAEIIDEQGNVNGVTVKLIRILQQRLNQPASIELMPWSRALNIAKEAKNVGLFETVYTEKRAALFKWVGPLRINSISLYGVETRLGNDVTQLVFPGKLIACSYRDSATSEEIMQLGFVEGKNLVLTTRSGDCLEMLVLGRVDLIAITEGSVSKFLPRLASTSENLIKVHTLSERRRYLAFSKDIPDETVALWQAALEQSYLDGTMRKLYQPVYGEDIIHRLEQFAEQKHRIERTATPSINWHY
ncbi:substrate-binding periplasmic protein [Rheinheimera metallidurans]|uniref:substrate-binding periplasmic protein n=1 Tax=Rheinheimera metallidurans TaxID=2925781 RepID=UPI003002F6F0